MRILRVKNSEELAIQTEALLWKLCQKLGRPIRGFLPAGSSAQGTYQKMIEHRDQWQGKIHFIQIDEFVGGHEFFLEGLRTQILRPLKLESTAETIHSDWNESQFQNHLQQVLKTKIDFALLGLGPNGHVGFHEPGDRGAEFLGGLVQLTDESFQRVKGAPSAKAFSFGAGSFLKAEEIILLATGNGKERVFSEFLKQDPNKKIPATLLKSHPGFTVITTINEI